MLTCERCHAENPAGFAFCGSCGARLGPDPAEVRKVVTVVFADVTGSTSLGEQLDAESLRSVISRYFETARMLLERHGGTVEKFIGDAVVGVFGIPEAHEDDALRGVRAAADLREALVTLNQELVRDFGTTIQIRTGVNSGEVMAGDPSSDQSFMSGDAVNVAARLEQSAQPGEILIGAPTLALTRDAVEVEPVPPLSLKGKSEPVPAFRLLEVSRQGPPITRRPDAPMVGRADELATLITAFEQAEVDSACRAVTILGDAGVGKTRLIRALSERMADRALILEGHCLPYGEGITFWPIAEIVKRSAGIDDDDAPDTARAKIGTTVRETGPEADLVAERVANAIGLGDAEGSIQETFWAIRRLFELLGGERTLVPVIEDAHWASPTLLDLIDYIASFSVSAPVLLVCTARPELHEEHPERARLGQTIHLRPLAREDSSKLVGNLLDDEGIPTDVRASVLDRAGGNPLFLEEMVRMLIDEGTLRREDGRWISDASSGGAAPATVQAVISARLDRLEDEERAVLQRGSIVGKVFYWGAVTELSPPTARGQVGGHLQTLTRRELIQPEASTLVGEDAFRFSHGLIHDAAYASTPKRTRAELHERFAGWLEAVAGPRLSEFDEIVGYHHEQAFRYLENLGPVDDSARAVATRAAARLAAAGRRASSRGDAAAATDLLTRATALLPDLDPTRVELLPILGAALTDAGRWQEAADVLERAVDEARRIGDQRSEGRAVVKALWLGLHAGTFGSNEDAIPDLERATDLFEGLGDEAGLAEGWILRGSIAFWSGDGARAVEAADTALGHARRAGDARREVDALRLRSFWQVWSATPVSAALEGLDELSRTPAAANSPMLRSYIPRVRGLLEAQRGHLEEAHALDETSKASARELGLEMDRSAALVAAGYLWTMEGNHVEAEKEFAEAIAFYRTIGDEGHLSSYAPSLADAVASQGRLDEALALTEEAERTAIEGDTDAQVHWRRVRAKVYARQGRPDEALELASEAVGFARTSDDVDKLGRTLLDLAEVLRLEGRDEEARSVATEAFEVFDRKGNVLMAATARRAAGDP